MSPKTDWSSGHTGTCCVKRVTGHVIEMCFKLTSEVEAGVEKLGAGVMAALLLMVAASCGESSDSRDRNVQSIAGQPCANLGLTQRVSKVVNVCGRNGDDLVWYAAVAKKPTGPKCTRPGGFRTASPSPLVCAVIGKKRMWIAVAPMPFMATTTLPAAAGDVEASGNTSVEASTTLPPSSTSTSTVPKVAEIPSKPIDPTTAVAVAKASAPATRLTLTTKGKTSRNGDPMFPAPVVQLVDDSGDPRPIAGVRVRAVVAATGYEVTGNAATTDADGSATFPDLRVLGEAAKLDVVFVADEYTGAMQSIDHAVGQEVSLAWVQWSTDVIAGQLWARQPVVQLVDMAGVPVAKAGINLVYTAKLGKGSPSPLGMVETNEQGQGFLTGAVIDTAGEFATEVVAPGASLRSPPLTVKVRPADAARLAIVSHVPASMASGIPIGDVEIQLTDSFGNVVTKAGVTVEASATSLGFGPDVEVAFVESDFRGGKKATAVTDKSGVAIFKEFLVMGQVGTWTLSFKNADDPSWAPVAVDFTLQAGLPVRLGTVDVPTVVRSGLKFDQVPMVVAIDITGNHVSSLKGNVTVSTANEDEASVSNGVAAFGEDGIARFTDLTLTGTAGSVVLVFSFGNLVESVLVTLSYGAVDSFVITEMPSSVAADETFTAAVQLRDSAGNVVRTTGIVAQVSLGGTDFKLASQSGNSGTITFSFSKPIEVAAEYTLTFTVVTDVAPRLLVMTAPLSVRASNGVKVRFPTTDSVKAANGKVFDSVITTQVLDQFGNPAKKAGVRVVAEVVDGIDKVASFDGSTAVTDDFGIARFDKLKLVAKAGDYNLRFAVENSGRPLTYPNPITVRAGVATGLKIVRGAAGLRNRELATVQPIIQVIDSMGNDAPLADVWVQAYISPSTGSVGSRGFVRTNSAGRAEFVNLKPVGSRAGSTSTIDYRVDDLQSVSETVTVAGGIAKTFAIGMASVVSSGTRLGALSGVDVDGNATTVDEFITSLPDIGTPSPGKLLWLSVDSENKLVVHGLKGTTATIRVVERANRTKVVHTFSFTINTDPKVGDPGPAGGLIIHDTAEGMKPVTSISAGGRFLETAPTNWSGRANILPINIVDSLRSPYTLLGATTSTGALQGGNNTKSIVAQQANRPTAYGPKIVESLRLGDLDDWFLPSSEEFKLILRQPEDRWRSSCGVFTKFMTSTLTGTKTTANFFDSTTNPWSLKSLSVETSACIVPIRAFG